MADYFAPSEKQWKKVGRSRKKVESYLCAPTPDSLQEYYAKLSAIESRLESEGIDLVVRPSVSVKRLSWCTGVDLCIPVEVRSGEEVQALARLAKRLLKGETSLVSEFVGYEYGRAEWLADADYQGPPASETACSSVHQRQLEQTVILHKFAGHFFAHLAEPFLVQGQLLFPFIRIDLVEFVELGFV